VTSPASSSTSSPHDLKTARCPLEVRALGRTIARWRDQIVAWHRARVSNGPTEAVNNLVKRVKRVAFGITNFRNYRIRRCSTPEAQLGPTRHPHTPLKRGEPPAGILIDMVEGNTASDLREWCQPTTHRVAGGIKTVSIDLTDSYRAGLSPHLDHAVRVADPFHVVRVANRCLDQVRRRVQNETKGHRGRKGRPAVSDPQAAIERQRTPRPQGQDRMLLGLRVGDPYDEVAGAWLAKESVRDVYLVDDPPTPPPSRQDHHRLPRRRRRRDPSPRPHPRPVADRDPQPSSGTGASNGPTEGLNLVIKKVKRAGHGFHRFDHYRLRCLLHAGGITWPNRPSPPRIRTRQSPLG
jgi:transposase